MPNVELINYDLLSGDIESLRPAAPPSQFTKNKRKLTQDEISILKQNGVTAEYWDRIFVSEIFNPELIKNVEFYGTIYIGTLRNGVLKHHDLKLVCGIYNSMVVSSIIGDNCVIKNVSFMQNYIVDEKSVVFNVNELCATEHAKFGNGIIRAGEPEKNRIWIETANESGARSILPFDGMITADAFIWSRLRENGRLQKRLVEITDRLTVNASAGGYGYIGKQSIIKHTGIVKDAYIGDSAYIKGASKLKNITIQSSFEEPSQIGEGVEMVNGIMGYGSKIFYQAVAVRFVIGRNCQLKYGARLLNSVMGDNSTVSCCELLNNLLYPFHEQHHNTSFLIASTVLGQSNIAAGATIGSNHNSRSPDGEIYAGRGFWPGLCTDFKHNSYFASFCLFAKGSYQYEMNIRYPFALVSANAGDESLTIMPAYWFIYNMFAMARNNYKFKSRDKRKVKIQQIETDFLAPDTAGEMLAALERIYILAARRDGVNGKNGSEMVKSGKDTMDNPLNKDIVLYDELSIKKGEAKIIKAYQAVCEYKNMLLYYAFSKIIGVMGEISIGNLKKLFENNRKLKVYTRWVNVGGQIMPQDKLDKLADDIAVGKHDSWDEIHAEYSKIHSEYDADSVRYAIHVIEEVTGVSCKSMDDKMILEITGRVAAYAEEIYRRSKESRIKDFDDYFRKITSDNDAQFEAVYGKIDDNDFLKVLRCDIDDFVAKLELINKN